MSGRGPAPSAREPAGARLRRLLERRLPALTRQKTPEQLPVELSRRRIYIVPTRFGFAFAAILVVMLVGALNYVNNSALLLTCLLGGVAINSMLGTFRNLDGLVLRALHADAACAGDPVRVQLQFDQGGRERPALRLDGYGGQTVSRLGPDGQRVELQLPTHRRGWMPLPRIRVQTTWPFGLFRAWSWLHPQHAILVYPAPEAAGPPARGQDANPHRREARDGDELAGLREYRAGDPIKHIAWKLSARHRDLMVRELDRPAAQDARVLDWARLAGLDPERRIARLARWVGEAHAEGLPWTLRLPDAVWGPASGSEHYHRCMSALALLP